MSDAPDKTPEEAPQAATPESTPEPSAPAADDGEEAKAETASGSESAPPEPAADDAAEPAAEEAAKPAAAKAEPAAAEKPAAPKAAPAKPKPAAAPPSDVSRRGFFSWAAVAWVGFTAAIGGCVTAMGRFMFPNVLFEPPTRFKVGRPEEFPEGIVDTRYKESNGVWIVNSDGRLYALIAICTHLGCPPSWLEAQNKFKCPCHGSGYYKNGINFEGPTPRPLERAAISIDPEDGQLVVDKARKFQWELGQWDDPDSFVRIT